jgi:hypothetical protein
VYREVSEMPRCVCCGILIPASPLRFRHHDTDLYACSERCTRVYDTYKFPRYEAEIRALERAGDAAARLGYVTA